MKTLPETIEWRDATLELPEVDATVLGFRVEWAEGSWPVFWDGEDWHSAEGFTLRADHSKPDFLPPTHWAPLPAGPATAPEEAKR